MVKQKFKIGEKGRIYSGNGHFDVTIISKQVGHKVKIKVPFISGDDIIWEDVRRIRKIK